MNIFPYNTDIERDIKAIKKQLPLSMNGISSDRMKEYGINYKKNYGLSLPRIKELAKRYTPNTQLATQLWAIGYRETMIMATLLYPSTDFSAEMAEKWANQCMCSEICEQFIFNLIKNTCYTKTKTLEWLNSDNIYVQLCGLLLSSRTAEQFDKSEQESIINKNIELSLTDNFALYHGISVSLRFFCRLKRGDAYDILAKISTFENANSLAQKYIYQEVKQEIQFLYDS